MDHLKPGVLSFLIFLMLVVNLPASAQKQLSLPVDFMIENGDFEQTVVTVKKEGKEIYSVPGKTFLRLKLMFQSDYVLSFSKPGYITKLIAVNTNVPEERMQQEFDPYKIGVKIFKQYEGVNTVVYSQPVARIYFNPSLDDFDYDVDYTKAILSILKQTEDELMVKAAAERSAASSGKIIPAGEENNSSASSDYKSGASTSNATYDLNSSNNRQSSILEPSIRKQSKTGEQTFAGESQNDQNKLADADPKPSPPVNAAEDLNTKPQLQRGDDQQENKSGVKDADVPPPAEGIAGADKRITESIVIAGRDVNLSAQDHSGDMEERPVTSADADRAMMNKFVETDGNKTITTFRITKGLSIAEYRKVDYVWGGTFYFKDGKYNISRNIFHWATGEF